VGLLRNSNQAKQGIDFEGLQWGKIHPSDIDFVFEFKNDVLILGEVKRKGTEIPVGQRLMLERICDSWHNGKSFIIFVHHEQEDETTDIPLNKCEVYKLYYQKKWRYRNGSVKDKIELILKHFKIDL
jgi:hypothetical protein|tara:strand:- start:886 stop:1266 length:381 start_codon:yes stop_codon:yes gene_type:complete